VQQLHHQWLKRNTVAALESGHKKIRQSCELPDLYEGWVSKHNPYTILERIFSTKKLFIAFRKSGQKMLTRYPQSV
jgi:hypothetical protein